MKCSKCNQETAEQRFATYRNSTGEIRRRGVCRVCRNKYATENFERLKEWRKKYNTQNRSRQAERSARLRQEAKELVDKIKTSACIDCGGSFPSVCMDFDHVRDVKVASISTMVSSGYKTDLIEKEIAKCDLVCANCHRIRTRDRKQN